MANTSKFNLTTMALRKRQSDLRKRLTYLKLKEQQEKRSKLCQ